MSNEPEPVHPVQFFAEPPEPPSRFFVVWSKKDGPPAVGDEVTVYDAGQIEPWTARAADDDCENCGDMRAQLSAAEADRDRMRPVVEAAETYLHARRRIAAAIEAWLRMERL